MKLLTQNQVAKWCKDVGQIEDPYTGSVAPPFRGQFRAPLTYRQVECFVRCMLCDIVFGNEVLIVLMDMAPATRSQEIIYSALRCSFAEQHATADTPGYLLSRENIEYGVALFSISVCFGWKSYLYGRQDQVILYNWEGDILDFWTEAKERYAQAEDVFRNFGLEAIRAPA